MIEQDVIGIILRLKRGHIWICRENDTTITQIINEAFEKFKIKLDNLEFNINFNYHAKLLYILKNDLWLFLMIVFSMKL